MFIKIVRGQHESTHECERFHTQPIGKNKFMIDFEPSGISVEIDKTVPEAVGVYVMNQEGRTIDTVFRKDEDG